MTRPRNPEPAAPAAGGLWIRVAANLARRKVTGRLWASCLASFPVPDGAPRSLYQKAAVGFLVELWGNIAEHTTDGVIVDLPDQLLEQWAGWDGEPLAFARWLRAAHLDNETGKCREWDEMQGVLQTRREADAERQRRKRALDKLANRPIDEVDLGDGSAVAHSSTSTEGEKRARPTVDAAFIAQQLCIAANRGMNDNPAIGDAYNPILATRGDSLETVEAFVSEGLDDWTMVGRIVYTIAKHYKPEKRGDYVRSLTFFKNRTVLVYKRHVAKVAAGAGDAPGEVSIESGGRPTAVTKAARTGSGAMAAARAAGLDE